MAFVIVDAMNTLVLSWMQRHNILRLYYDHDNNYKVS